MKDSLKLATRANRWTGARKRVSSHAKLPGNWKTNFSRNDDNEDGLFLFLGQECQNTDGLQPCSHEEAYIRMLRHVKGPMKCGLKSVTIITVGTDVVVVAVAHFQDLPNRKNCT